MTAHQELPAPPVMIFDGTSAEYPKFIRNFSDRVGTKSFTDSFKLSQLIMCSRGEAKKATDRYEGTSKGYEMAWKVLHERFGQPFQIVKSSVDRLTAGPRIQAQDRKSLLEFADQLEATLQTLDDQHLLAEANTQTSLQAIFSRLPAHVQGKWVKKVVDLEAANIQPTLKHLVRLVSSLANTANHAVYAVAASGRNNQNAVTGGSKGHGKGFEITKTSHTRAPEKKSTCTTMSTQPMSDQGVAKSGQQESSTGHSVQRNGAKFTRVSRPRNNAAKVRPGAVVVIARLKPKARET
ncbi:uncharacterized protein LOC135486747 [Lineus longissimus]|uniref:uncharacterized protein LOC135486747 n=1 Tax=Lineus longissimus TaxID=88925 RepID=UPI00315C8FF3